MRCCNGKERARPSPCAGTRSSRRATPILDMLTEVGDQAIRRAILTYAGELQAAILTMAGRGRDIKYSRSARVT